MRAWINHITSDIKTELCQIIRNRARTFHYQKTTQGHIRLHSLRQQTGNHYRGQVNWSCENEIFRGSNARSGDRLDGRRQLAVVRHISTCFYEATCNSMLNNVWRLWVPTASVKERCSLQNSHELSNSRTEYLIRCPQLCPYKMSHFSDLSKRDPNAQRFPTNLDLLSK